MGCGSSKISTTVQPSLREASSQPSPEESTTLPKASDQLKTGTSTITTEDLENQKSTVNNINSHHCVNDVNENEDNICENQTLKPSTIFRIGSRVPFDRNQDFLYFVEKLPVVPEVNEEEETYSSHQLKCPLVILAKEYIGSLSWPESFFEEKRDRCFCEDCYPTTCENVLFAGGAPYVAPRGWTRLGLHVDAALAEQHDIWNKWIVTFHGTTKVAIHSILTHRHFTLPGDTLTDGTVLDIREGHFRNEKCIFTSPTIAYASLPVYCSRNLFYSHADDTNYEVQMVLQCRQQAGSFRIQGETVGAEPTRICSYIPNETIEYITDIRSSIIPYGLLVQMKKVYSPM